LRKIISALLILALVFSLCALTACGDGDSKAYRVIETIGTKEYGSVCRYGDKAAAVVDAAMQVLSANGTLSSISVDWLGEDLISIEGDAEALEIYANAYSTDADFYAYWRSLQALEAALDENSTLVLDSSHPLWKDLLAYATRYSAD